MCWYCYTNHKIIVCWTYTLFDLSKDTKWLIGRKYDYQIYPKAYAEKFVNKQIDIADLLKHLPEKKNQSSFSRTTTKVSGQRKDFKQALHRNELPGVDARKVVKIIALPKSNMTDQSMPISKVPVSWRLRGKSVLNSGCSKSDVFNSNHDRGIYATSSS